MKKYFLLPLLLLSSVLFAGCNQNDSNNAEPSPEDGYEINSREDNTTMEKPIDFNLENTIKVLADALVDAHVAEESIIIVALQRAGIRGVVQAKLIDEPGRVLLLEIVSEDGKTYQMDVARQVFSDITYYAVDAIRDMQSGEFIFTEECGFGDANP